MATNTDLNNDKAARVEAEVRAQVLQDDNAFQGVHAGAKERLHDFTSSSDAKGTNLVVIDVSDVHEEDKRHETLGDWESRLVIGLVKSRKLSVDTLTVATLTVAVYEPFHADAKGKHIMPLWWYAQTKRREEAVDTSWEKCLMLPWKLVDEAIPLSYATKAIHDVSGSREALNEDGTMVRKTWRSGTQQRNPPALSSQSGAPVRASNAYEYANTIAGHRKATDSWLKEQLFAGRPQGKMGSDNKRRERDVMKLMMNDYKVEMVNDRINEFHVEFVGPKDSPYEGGHWKLHVELSDAYPYESPSITFVNRIYHPNVHKSAGHVCLDVINENWSPMFDLVNVFEVFLPQLLLYPNTAHGLNDEAAAMLMHEPTAFNKKVQEYVQRYAKAEDIHAAADDAVCPAAGDDDASSLSDASSRGGYSSDEEDAAATSDP
eukprot:jgi/Tetstr1/464319/TSEL_009121.t1